ncbi:MAG TPA: methyltransferase domain-containing protein [Phycisphaerae bacterium]|nr:methyltransferase domain-containing protein [Phycisphaerae bacterium]
MKRLRRRELMDDPAIGPAEHAHALATLNWINRVLLAHRKLYRYLLELGDPRRMSILDLGAGGGGLLGHIIRQRERGRRRDLHDAQVGGEARLPVLVGVDCSPFAVACARKWQGAEFHGVVGDVRRLPLADNSVDAVACRLLVHHFDEDDVVTILREAARVARRGIVVMDLSRSWISWGLTWLTTRVVSRSRVFHQDGPRSVRAAYLPGEVAALAELAGLRGARVKHIFPFRLVLAWRKR